MNKFLKIIILTFGVCLLMDFSLGLTKFGTALAQQSAQSKIIKGMPLSIELKLSGGEYVSEGEIRNVVAKIRNNSDKIIVLKDLQVFCGKETGIENFLYSISGLLEYNKRDDSYYYNSLVQEETPAVFVRGFLLPGKNIESVIPVKILAKDVKITLSFYSFTLDDLVEALYIPSETIELVNTKFMPGSRSKVKKIMEEENFKFIQVIFRPPAHFKSKYFASDFGLEVNLKRFSYKDALQRIQASESSNYTYFNLAAGWIIERRRQLFLVRKDQIVPYPEMDFNIFKYVDEMADPKGKIILTFNEQSYPYFKDVYSVQAVKSQMYFTGIPFILDLPRNEFLNFVKACYQNNLKLRFRFYTAGKWCIDVR